MTGIPYFVFAHNINYYSERKTLEPINNNTVKETNGTESDVLNDAKQSHMYLHST